MDDLIRRLAAIDEVNKHRYVFKNKHLNDYEQGWNDACDYCVDKWLEQLPSVQHEDWLERNKERILQAGMEGREIEFRIGGRLFAIREKAQ